MGLYKGLKMADIHKHKGLKPSQKILDHMGSAELAAIYFRATQAEEKLRQEEEKRRAATDVIDNSGDEAATQHQAEALVRRLLAEG